MFSASLNKTFPSFLEQHSNKITRLWSVCPILVRERSGPLAFVVFKIMRLEIAISPVMSSVIHLLLEEELTMIVVQYNKGFNVYIQSKLL